MLKERISDFFFTNYCITNLYGMVLVKFFLVFFNCYFEKELKTEILFSAAFWWSRPESGRNNCDTFLGKKVVQ